MKIQHFASLDESLETQIASFPLRWKSTQLKRESLGLMEVSECDLRITV